MASSKNSILDRPAAPVVALLLGATMWGVIWYPMRLVEAQGLSGLWLSLLIYLAALIASLPVTGPRFKEIIEAPGILIPIALAAGWTNIAFVLAILDGNIMRVLLLFYLTPLWATLLGWGVLGERISKRAGIVLVIALLGAIVMLWDPEQGSPWPRSHADWLAITSGMAFAVSNLYVRKGQTVSLAAKLGVTWVGVVVIALILIGAMEQSTPVLNFAVIASTAGVGILGILLMTTLVQYGVTHMPIHRSAVILLFELVAGALSQQLLTDEVMSPVEWTGGGLIVLAAYLSMRRQRSSSS